MARQVVEITRVALVVSIDRTMPRDVQIQLPDRLLVYAELEVLSHASMANSKTNPLCGAIPDSVLAGTHCRTRHPPKPMVGCQYDKHARLRQQFGLYGESRFGQDQAIWCSRKSLVRRQKSTSTHSACWVGVCPPIDRLARGAMGRPVDLLHRDPAGSGDQFEGLPETVLDSLPIEVVPQSAELTRNSWSEIDAFVSVLRTNFSHSLLLWRSCCARKPLCQLLRRVCIVMAYAAKNHEIRLGVGPSHGPRLDVVDDHSPRSVTADATCPSTAIEKIMHRVAGNRRSAVTDGTMTFVRYPKAPEP